MFGEKLKNIREEKRLSITDLAALVGVLVTRITRWENNRSYPSMENLIHLCNILDVSTDYLCDTDYDNFVGLEELSDEMIVCLQALIDQMRLEKQKYR